MENTKGIKCPHCGFVNSIREVGKQLVLCDSEDGGCDTYFAADVRKIVSYEVETFTLTPSEQAKG